MISVMGYGIQGQGQTIFAVSTSDGNVYTELPGNCSNIALNADNRLYVCCNFGDGAIFRTADSP